MHFQKYTDTRFAMHQIKGAWKGNVSAFFNEKGDPIDAEFTGTGRKVKQGSKTWNRLISIGRAWKSKLKENPAAPSN